MDDVPINLRVVSAVLRQEGFRIETAADGQQALDLIPSVHPDLVLSDIQMPVMNGIELAQRIKQDKSLRHIPVIALTAFSMNIDEQQALEAGFDGYLTKPINTRTIGNSIRRYLSQRPRSLAHGPA